MPKLFPETVIDWVLEASPSFHVKILVSFFQQLFAGIDKIFIFFLGGGGGGGGGLGAG